jgi:hypothetical protein
MNHLKELILLYLISALILSCTKNINENVISSKRPFSPYYFAIKNPTMQDYTMLNEYMNIYGPPVKYEAAITLAGYYVKIHEYGKATNLLMKYIELIDKRTFLGILGNMWLFVSYEKLNNKKATTIYKKLEKYKDYSEYEKSLKAFCISISEPIYIKNKNCLERYGEKYVKNPILNRINQDKNKEYDERSINNVTKLNKPIKIYINKRYTGLDLMNGALFALYTLGLDFEVATDNEDNNYKYVIDSDGNNYFLKNDEDIDFSWNFYKGLEEFYKNNVDIIKNTVIIVVKEDFMTSAKHLGNLFKKEGQIVRTIIYTEYGFRDDLEGIYKKYGNDITLISIGHEGDIVDFIPLIRFIFAYKIPVYAMIDCFTGLYLEKYYADYFNYTNIYTFSDLISEENKAFFNNYKNFYGIKPGANALIGYDMILYIAYLNKAVTKPNYLSGIINVNSKTKEVLRTLKYYYIKNNNIEYYKESNLH